ncbi:hypothetical protein [Acinetobacter pittii]|uniref:hypothetical protein n=1 Tax=Acinetobacter pittii TaxID=48296 RepID=UPI003A8AE308
MTKHTYENLLLSGNGGDGFKSVGNHDLSMKNIISTDNKGDGINVISDQTLKDAGLSLSLDSKIIQELLAELRNIQPENRQVTIVQKLAPYLEPTANITSIVASILSIVST